MDMSITGRKPHPGGNTLRQLLCVALICLLLLPILVGCGKKKVSEEPEADQQQMGKDLINQVPSPDGGTAPAPPPPPPPAEGD